MYFGRLWILPVAIMVSLPCPAADGDLEKGMAALAGNNYAEAFCYWRPLAEQGDAEAQYNLGWLYANGNGMNVDTKTALHWWQRAAKTGHQDARFALGMAYITGEGIRENPGEAMKWFLLAANDGMQDARDIINRLGSNPRYRILEEHPQLLQYAWYGRQAQVRGDRVNVRKSPSTKARVITQLAKGAKVRVVAASADWVKIIMKTKSQPGWVYRPLIRFLD